jgi:hypothetical protein
MEDTMPENTDTRRDWEVVQEDTGESKTDRLRVLDGYLYRTVMHNGAVAMVFVKSVATK